MKFNFSTIVGRASGSFVINNTEQHNLFTDFGMSEIYKSGKNSVINTSGGGIFKHCRIGNGATQLTEQSTQLSNGIPLTSTLTSTRLSYATEGGVRFAQGVFNYTFSGDYEGEITELMITSQASNNGMICGRTLTTPLIIASGDVIKVTYVVKIPIISEIGNVLDIGTMTTETGDVIGYTFYGRFHEESSISLNTIIPLESEWDISTNTSRMYVNNILQPIGTTRYKCEQVIDGNTFSYNIKSALMGNSGDISIINANIANTDSSGTTIENFPFRIIFGSLVNKPDGFDLLIDFGINIVIGD